MFDGVGLKSARRSHRAAQVVNWFETEEGQKYLAANPPMSSHVQHQQPDTYQVVEYRVIGSQRPNYGASAKAEVGPVPA